MIKYLRKMAECIRAWLHIPSLENGLEEVERRTAELNKQINDLKLRIDQQNNQLVQMTKRGQDLMVLLQNKFEAIKPPNMQLSTDHPIANTSHDYIFPRGAANDNTRYPRFAAKCTRLFKRSLNYLDLGCAGGGLVLDFLLAGHQAIGLEGSDYQLKNQSSEWRTIPQHLFTCDITKPFKIIKGTVSTQCKFDLITCWEVLEHIEETDLAGLFDNISLHLKPEGFFIASVATFEDNDPETGAKWHVTVKPQNWWEAKVKEFGFQIVDNKFEITDFPRGSGNGIDDWNATTNPELGFHLVLKKG